ncbi:MAG: M28 family peptidase, partial [Planctomycetota bacterium]
SFTAEKEICYNLEIEITGVSKPEEIVIIGAHYDTVFGTVGANDNGSGVAAALALVRRFKGRKIGRTLRFALFANEEPPFFQTDAMGSVVYAKSCREKKENIVAMLSLETIGYYTDEPKSQQYPFPFNMFYPSTGNFIGFVSNVSSRQLLKQVIKTFRENCKFPSEGGAVPEFVPGIGWSDHWAFWKYGYPAVMVTDTAPFRYPYYHGPEDTPEKIDYERLAIVVSGIEAVVDSLVIVPGSSDK